MACGLVIYFFSDKSTAAPPFLHSIYLHFFIYRYALWKSVEGRRLWQHTSLRAWIRISQASLDLRPISKQVSPAGRISRLCAQYVIQSSRNISISMPCRFLHKLAKLSAREDGRENRRTFHVIQVDFSRCSSCCRLGN